MRLHTSQDGNCLEQILSTLNVPASLAMFETVCSAVRELGAGRAALATAPQWACEICFPPLTTQAREAQCQSSRGGRRQLSWAHRGQAEVGLMQEDRLYHLGRKWEYGRLGHLAYLLPPGRAAKLPITFCQSIKSP